MGDGIGRGKEGKNNFVRVIRLIETHLIRSIDPSIYRVQLTENTRKTTRASFSRATRTESRALRALTCIHVQRLAEAGGDRGAHDPLHQFSRAQRTGRRIFPVNIYPYSSGEIDPYRPGSQKKISERAAFIDLLYSLSSPAAETIKLLRRRVVAMLMTQPPPPPSLPPASGIGLNRIESFSSRSSILNVCPLFHQVSLLEIAI